MSSRHYKPLLIGCALAFGLAAAAVSAWVSRGNAPVIGAVLPDYDRLNAFDPAREGGHLRPNLKVWASGHFKDQPVRFITNSKGFRNDREFSYSPPEGRLRILFLGDSFVDGMRTDQSRTIGFQLERNLNESGTPAEVLIAGQDNPANAWYYFQEHGRRYRPRLVILAVTMGNDLAWHGYGTTFAPERDAEGETVLRLKNGSKPSAGKYESLLLPPAAYLPSGVWDKVWEAELGWRHAAARKFNFFSQEVEPLLGPYPGERRKVYAAGYFMSLGLYYRPLMPEMEDLFRDFEAVLAGFEDRVRKSGAKFAVVLFPARIEVSTKDWGLLRRAYSLDAARFDLNYPAARVLEICRERQIECFDLGPVFREAYRKKKGPLYGPLGDMHFNDDGQSLAASHLARVIEKIAP